MLWGAFQQVFTLVFGLCRYGIVYPFCFSSF